MASPYELTAAITAVALLIAKDKTTDQLSVLGAAFAQLGDTLSTIAVQQGIAEQKKC